jgi:hypothetical protein
MNTLRTLLLSTSLCLSGFTFASAQNTVFTYQGRVRVSGTDFTGNGQFKFALVTGTNQTLRATATANLSGSFVVSYNVTFGGNGYFSAPAVTIFGGGGSGATAHAVVSGGAVTAVVPDNAGSGYTSAPTVTIDPPPSITTFTTFWSNDGTSVAGSEPAAAVNIPVSGGLFTVLLGDTGLVNMASIDVSVLLNANLQLRIWFNDGVNGFAPLDPPQGLTPAPYAAVAGALPGIASSASLVQVSGDLQTSGNATLGGDLRLNEGNLWLRGGNDTNSGLGWFGAGKSFGDFSSPAPDGPVLFGSNGGGLGVTTNGQQKVALAWDAQQRVGIGTVTPGARLSLGPDEKDSKLLVFDDGIGNRAGLGFTNSQFRLHLPGSGRFAFMTAPSGGEVMSISAGGNVGIGTNSPNRKLVVNGDIGVSSANLLVPGGVENLRILRGRIAGSGIVSSGQGFTVSKTGTGAYTVTFSTPFSTEPSVTATPQIIGARIVTCTSVLLGSAGFRTFDSTTAAAVDQDFQFIVIGPR